MDNEKDRIIAVKAANALLKEAGLKQTWVVGVEDVAIEGDDYFRLKGYTWDRYMSPTVLMAIAADALKDIHEEYGVSVDYIMRFIIERIAGDDGGSAMREADWRRKQVDVLAGAILLVAKQTGTGGYGHYAQRRGAANEAAGGAWTE